MEMRKKLLHEIRNFEAVRPGTGSRFDLAVDEQLRAEILAIENEAKRLLDVMAKGCQR